MFGAFFWNIFIWIQIAMRFVPKGSIEYKLTFGLDNGLTLHMRQATT